MQTKPNLCRTSCDAGAELGTGCADGNNAGGEFTTSYQRYEFVFERFEAIDGELRPLLRVTPWRRAGGLEFDGGFAV